MIVYNGYRKSGFFRWEQISGISRNPWQFAKIGGTKLSLLDRHAHKLINFILHMRCMALLKYFKKSCFFLPNPDDSISERMPSSSIASANKEIGSLVDKERCGSKRGHGNREQKPVAKRVSEMGVTNEIQFFRKTFSDRVELSRGLQVC